jgi:hypothetical protein
MTLADRPKSAKENCMETTQDKTINEILEIEAKAKTEHGANNFQFIWESERDEDGDTLKMFTYSREMAEFYQGDGRGAVLEVDQA